MDENGLFARFVEEKNKFDNLVTEKEGIEDSIEETKQTIIDITTNLVIHYIETDNEEGIQNIYWCEYEGISKVIKDTYKQKTGIIFKPKPLETGEYCDSCGKQLFAKSKLEYKSYLCGKWRSTCDDCVKVANKVNQGRYREYAEQRELELQALKTMKYSEYLKTDHWAGLRKRMLQKAGYRCQLCGGAGILNVHHRTYENRGEESYSDLIVLCSGCHSKFHDKIGE